MKKIYKYVTDKVLCGSLIIILTIPSTIIGFIFWKEDVQLFSGKWLGGMSIVLFLLIIWFIGFVYAEHHNLTRPKGKNKLKN